MAPALAGGGLLPLLAFGHSCFGAFGARQANFQATLGPGVRQSSGSLVEVAERESESCACPGRTLAGEDVLRQIVDSDGLLRVRKSAQRLCDQLRERGSLGKAEDAAVAYYACEVQGKPLGYCCKPMDKAAAALKRHAPENLNKKDLALFTQVNSGYTRLQTMLEDTATGSLVGVPAPPQLGEAARRLADQRALVERKEMHCRHNMDDLSCGDPLHFLLSLRHLYRDLAADISTLRFATMTCDNAQHRVISGVKKGGLLAALAAKQARRVATGFVADGRRVMGLIWRNRIGLFAGVIAAQGAQPVIDALTDAGLDSVMSGSAGEALEEVVAAMKPIACKLLQEPVLMASLMSMASRVVGNGLLRVFSARAETVDDDEEPALSEKERAQRAALRKKQRGIIQRANDRMRSVGQGLSTFGSEPFAAQLLVLFASDFFNELAEGLCASMGLSPGGQPLESGKNPLVEGALNGLAHDPGSSTKDFASLASDGMEQMILPDDLMMEATGVPHEDHHEPAASKGGGSTVFAEAAAAGKTLLTRASKNKIQVPAVLGQLDGLLDNARFYMPLLTLLAWTSEHLLPEAATDMDAWWALYAQGKAPPKDKHVDLLNLKDLKQTSKQAKTEIESLAMAAIARCQASQFGKPANKTKAVGKVVDEDANSESDGSREASTE